MPAALSIDFGNTYTKVAFRAGENSQSQLIQSPNLSFDDDKFCIPTLAACLIVNGKEEWSYGLDVLNLQGQTHVHVIINWKPKFFEGVEQTLDGGVNSEYSESECPWDTFSDEELQKLLVCGGMTPEQIASINQVLSDRERKGLDPGAISVDVKQIAYGYFSWLRNFIDPYCRVKGLGNTEDVPVRITIPSFGVNAASAQLSLSAILSQSGWQIAAKDPVISEPVANMIGTISEGRNWVWIPSGQHPPQKSPSFAPMFGKSALFKSLRNPPAGRTIYRFMIVDLGGYTLDFAIVEFDLDSLEIVNTQTGQKDRVRRNFSQPLGVSDLDREVRNALLPTHQPVFDQMMNVSPLSRRALGFDTPREFVAAG